MLKEVGVHEVISLLGITVHEQVRVHVRGRRITIVHAGESVQFDLAL